MNMIAFERRTISYVYVPARASRLMNYVSGGRYFRMLMTQLARKWYARLKIDRVINRSVSLPINQIEKILGILKRIPIIDFSSKNLIKSN